MQMDALILSFVKDRNATIADVNHNGRGHQE